ncbi:MAG: restriction endonuclease [Candidatus Promineifilaceae bacterium]|nr:restriction endonuclease [Candidatus Promineifilaceae bacterium]
MYEDTAERRRRVRRAARLGMLLLGAVTVWLLGWLIYRWVLKPSWIIILPELIQEVVTLIETAGALALSSIWAGLACHQWIRERQNEEALAPATIEELCALSPKAFERYVAALFRLKGYTVTVRGKSGDGGVDLEVANGRGRRAIVQCKRYQNTVGPETVRELYGTLVHERVAHAFLVSTADISDAAREWARGKPMTLVDGEALIEIATSLRRRLTEP